jgi:hypothetical protein
MAEFEGGNAQRPSSWEALKLLAQAGSDEECKVSQESWSVNHSQITAWRAPSQTSEAQLRAQIEACGRELDLLLAEFDALRYSQPDLRAQIAERRRKLGIHLV